MTWSNTSVEVSQFYQSFFNLKCDRKYWKLITNKGM